MTDTLAAALAAAARGWRIFPVTTGTDDRGQASWKKPAVGAWQLLATTDPERIRKWWARLENLTGYGWHTAGHVAIDFDIEGGEQNLNAAGYTTPPTLKIVSGNREKPGRYTIVYKLPTGRRLKVTALCNFPAFRQFAGIDIRSSGGQIVGPGSHHATGGRYSDNGVDPTDAPPWLLSLSEDDKPDYLRVWTPKEVNARRNAQEKRERAADGAIVSDHAAFLREYFPISGPGQRYALTMRASFALVRRHLPKDQVVALLSDWLRLFAPSFDSGVAVAIAQMTDVVEKTFSRLAAGIIHVINHEAATAGLELNPRFAALCDCFLASPLDWNTKHVGVPVPQKTGQKESTGGFDVDEEARREAPVPRRVVRKKVLSERAKQFVVMLFKHVQYSLEVRGLQTVKWTVRQQLRTFELLTGEVLSMSSYYELVNKFITRQKADGEAIKATFAELLVTTLSSKDRGVASEFQVPWLEESQKEVEEPVDAGTAKGQPGVHVGNEGADTETAVAARPVPPVVVVRGAVRLDAVGSRGRRGGTGDRGGDAGPDCEARTEGGAEAGVGRSEGSKVRGIMPTETS